MAVEAAAADNRHSAQDESRLNDKTHTPAASVQARLDVGAQSDFDSNPRSPKRRRISPLGDEDVALQPSEANLQSASLGQIPAKPKTIEQELKRASVSATTPPQNVTPAARGPSLGPSMRIRVEGLPVLDNLATQVLSTLAKMTNTEIGEMLFGPPSQRGSEYKSLKSRFEQTKGIYFVNSPFLSPASLDLKEQHQIDVLRKANTATFMASVFSGEIGLRVMDLNFIEVFVPDNGRLLKAHGSIYLELKTQAFIAARRTAAVSPLQVMLDLFPPDMEKQMLVKRTGSRTLAPSEIDFLNRFTSRRDILYADIKNNNLDNLHERYRWDDFSREVSTYLNKNFDAIVYGGKERGESLNNSETKAQIPQGQMESQFHVQPVSQTQTPVAGASHNAAPPSIFPDLSDDDFVAQAARAAAIALQDSMDFLNAPNQVTRPSPPAPHQISASTRPDQSPFQNILRIEEPSKTTFQLVTPATATPGGSLTQISDSEVPHSSQTAPTQVLYERARIASTSKASPTGRKIPTPSHRRPWTQEEENALMTGLDRVKGPHWSQILAMYGPGGTVNESLKDRNQVQLKDKARNLKLFFLKAGIEVPYYLQYVTGDLKTRAPGQAEKREARERERQQEGGDLPLGDDSQDNLGMDVADLVSNQSSPNGEQELLEDEDEPPPDGSEAEGLNMVNGGSMGFDFDALAASAAAEVVQELDSNVWNSR